MKKARQQSYAFLVYWGMLEIRRIQRAFKPYPKWRIVDPRFWLSELRLVRYSGALAEALHNLAQFVSSDFEGFDEDRFWSEMADLNEKFSDLARDFRMLFDMRLQEIEGRNVAEQVAASDR